MLMSQQLTSKFFFLQIKRKYEADSDNKYDIQDRVTLSDARRIYQGIMPLASSVFWKQKVGGPKVWSLPTVSGLADELGDFFFQAAT